MRYFLKKFRSLDENYCQMHLKRALRDKLLSLSPEKVHH